jgi:hypothetical protein
MWLNWLPWRYIVRRAARARGFVDPITVLSHLHRFAQPSEVAAPLELLRAGVVFHARGLMNTSAIQHNLDWIWPYWAERQFDPHDVSFIPRAFSITHVNLTHRNWTAVGLPDLDYLPIVDPRGLVTPYWDGWSLDAWIVPAEGDALLPSQRGEVHQRLSWDDPQHLAVVTDAAQDGLRLESQVLVSLENGHPMCLQQVTGWSNRKAWLVVTLRPYNPEGVSFVHEVALQSDRRAWQVDGLRSVRFDQPVERNCLSTYRAGDIYARLPRAADARSITCDVGMCTAAALFEMTPGEARKVTVRVPLEADVTARMPVTSAPLIPGWSDALAGHCEATLPDAHWQFLYDAAVRTLVLHSPLDVYPGPYTYKRFWFRDAALILHAMLCVGLTPRARRVLDRFSLRQTHAGYFLSQEGEWDSNGEALWILDRYGQLTGTPPSPAWRMAIDRGAQWIEQKLLSESLDSPHAGLMPAGFSAEHLGANDFYYWDDFWSVAGLRSAAAMLAQYGDAPVAARLRARAERLMASIDRSIEVTAEHRGSVGIAASPHRRLDAGAIGSLAASYPLELWPPRDQRMLATVEFLLKNCFFEGGFFQDMIHSGINAYLTLHVAQVLLRAGDARYLELVETVADLASPTGQWPEAIHPRTKGGCMGDGHHVWAAAEWIMMVRNCFLREDDYDDRLVLASGIPSHWLEQPEAISFGPAPTRWGTVTVTLSPHGNRWQLRWQANWRGEPPTVHVALPGYRAVAEERSSNCVMLEPWQANASTMAEASSWSGSGAIQ